MAVQNRVKALEYNTFDVSGLMPGVFLAVNPNGFEHPCFLVRIVNDSDADLFISYDGSTFQDFIPAAETLQLPFQTNSQPNNDIAVMQKGTRVYVSGNAGAGTVYVIGYYQD